MMNFNRARDRLVNACRKDKDTARIVALVGVILMEVIGLL